MPTAAESLGAQLPLLAAAPFAGLLAAVSVLEMVARRWWESLANKAAVAVTAAVLATAQLLMSLGAAGAGALAHSMADYVSFIVLLATLFVIAGGIEVKGSLSGTPLANMTMLAVGAVLANLIGTTGAAMVLIRPYLRANARRRHQAHLVVFFILVVANAGGLLTPLGDPPLYLGFLKGVPFAWTLGLWLPWLFVNGVTLVVFNWVDQFVLNREERGRPDDGLLDELLQHERLRVHGGRNLLLLAAVIAVIVARGAGAGGGPWPFGVQEAALGALALVSYLVTPRAVHHGNHFSLRPMAAVAIVFFGIFAVMTGPLLMLNAHAPDLGVTATWQFFWVSGGVSSVLDNAPTYLAMTAVAAGQSGVSADGPQYLAALLATPAGPAQLAAISCGAVFMGCLTYLGNGPNLMVKEIAEHRGVTMPNFLAYAAAATAIMIPVFLATTWIFFTPA
ncbi:sodium:proton antiporter [Catellatospora sp. NPDC049609]|uniref:sodium:proton antiporter n=1 Tax=Catellatospora sp. NPDC049609 TaxID=3155505 RepID=UPI003414EBE9